MDEKALKSLLRDLCALPKETEWVEFKRNCGEPADIGAYISAISNAAALHGKPHGYVVWGIENETHNVVGTDFNPMTYRYKNQDLEHWLAICLVPRIDFRFHVFKSDKKQVALLEIPPATTQPVRFKESEFIRIGSHKKPLREHPDKERALWRVLDKAVFEKGVAKSGLTAKEVIELLSCDSYFQLINRQQPDGESATVDRLCEDGLIVRAGDDYYDILNLGAVLFAKSLADFDRLARKAVRMIFYRGNNRTAQAREHLGKRGYATGFVPAVGYLLDQLPYNEQIKQAIRYDVPVYPEEAIRELLANALVHQDFTITGTGPMIEVFNDRIEITNPGLPLIDVDRFIDSPPQSRNEALTSLMRRIGICEERGQGIDRVITAIEMHQLPPPEFLVSENHVKAVLFAPRKANEMNKEERVRACFHHCVLQYVSGSKMTNESLRKRLSISDTNYPAASAVIQQAIKAKKIKKWGHAKYVPYWA